MPTAPPGGLVDTVARLIAPPLSATPGHTVVVENKPGAGDVIGTDFVAKSAPDGHTFLMTHAGVMVYSAATLPSLPFDPIGDFTHPGMLVEAPSVLLVRGDSPFRSLADYVAAARTRPVRYGSSGVGSAPHILGAMLSARPGSASWTTRRTRAARRPSATCWAGTSRASWTPITTNLEALRNGQLRALAADRHWHLLAASEAGARPSPRRRSSHCRWTTCSGARGTGLPGWRLAKARGPVGSSRGRLPGCGGNGSRLT